jgi:ceramide glucosyltransferase
MKFVSTALDSLLVLITTVWVVMGPLVLFRVRYRKPPANAQGDAGLEPASILKPVSGIDDGLEANLRTFFSQDYPHYEVVFGVQGEEDPVLDLVRKLIREHPAVEARVVVHDGGRGINPKVSNLRAMLTTAAHDLMVVSDSNIRVHPTYLREMQAEMARPQVGLVTSLFAGVGEKTLGALIENTHLNATVVDGVVVPTELLGHPIAVGKSMMFRRSLIDKIGGLESVAYTLAEDYVIGRMFHEAGFDVRLCPVPVMNVIAKSTLATFCRRQLRWNMMRLRLQPFAYLLEPLTMPLFTAAVAIALGAPPLWTLAWAFGITALRDAVQWSMMRGTKGIALALLVIPLRDVLVFGTWFTTFPRRHVTWRGKRVRVSAGTRLFMETLPVTTKALFVEDRHGRVEVEGHERASWQPRVRGSDVLKEPSPKA